MSKKLGVIVNPIAGLGGRAALKGSDAPGVVEEARRLGISPESNIRAERALREVKATAPADLVIYTAPGEMGEEAARAAGIVPLVVGEIERGSTTYRDTQKIAGFMRDLGVDLLLFAGGDGTACDVFEAVGDALPVLGIPAGVKMHSAVFAQRPKDAGQIVGGYLRGALGLRMAEVMDIDEDLFRRGVVSARLRGYLKVPHNVHLVQGAKVGGFSPEAADLEGISLDIVERMEKDRSCLYVIGPGTTTKAIMDRLGLPCTLLGVDVVRDKALVAADVNESRLMELVRQGPVQVVVTVTGGQGYVFGRGNQQISPEVIRAAGRENILVVSTLEKLASIKGRVLRVDTGDEEVDRMLSGPQRVVTGYHREHVCLVEG